MVDPSQISGNKTTITKPESKKEVISLEPRSDEARIEGKR